MIRINKLTDYGFVLLAQFAISDVSSWHTARDLAVETGLPLPTVSKLLKVFSRSGLLAAHRGSRGGYSLTKPPHQISAADIIEIIDGPIAVTDCLNPRDTPSCAIEDSCSTRQHWRIISDKIHTALDQVSLAELSRTVSASKCLTGEPCGSLPGEACACGDHGKVLIGESKK